MATGYTCEIKNGQTFKEFIMGCAKAFGALVTMRDEPADAKIPIFKPSTHHQENVDKLKAELVSYEKMSPEDCTARALSAFEKAKDSYNKSLCKKAALSLKYDSMTIEVEAWKPPTDDHVGLKDFMLDQIKISKENDCNTSYISIPKKQTGDEWLAENLEISMQSLAYHTKEIKEDKTKIDGRNEWVADLKKSLN